MRCRCCLETFDHLGIVVADLEQHVGTARDDARGTGIERDAAGGPHRARSAQGRKLSSIATQNRASARPASLRTAIRVVPAWFCSPVNVMRYCQMPTIEVTTPIFSPAALQRVALLDMGFEVADMAAGLGGEARAAGEACIRAAPARIVRPLERSRAASMSASLTAPA